MTGRPSAFKAFALASTFSVADSAMLPMRSETRWSRGERSGALMGTIVEAPRPAVAGRSIGRYRTIWTHRCLSPYTHLLVVLHMLNAARDLSGPGTWRGVGGH